MEKLQQHSRVASIDIARGIIMVIMALDHTRDYVHIDAFNFDPTDLTKTNAAVFFTRWITHFCMPTFVLLSGVGIYLSREGKSLSEVSRFLLTRGIWFIFLEFVVMRFALFFNFYYDITFLSVLWLFGACMILMAGLIRLPYRVLLALGVLITLSHDLASLVPIDRTHPLFALWTLLMSFGFISIDPGHAVIVSYPVIPWLGVMLLGYCLGKLYVQADVASRRRRLIQLGIAGIAGFVILRLVNVYGDPRPWSEQKNFLFTVMSFLNATKYPVSLLFCLMTLGPLLMLLTRLEVKTSKWLSPFLTIGSVPLFYFVLHFYLIHAFALLFSTLESGHTVSEIDFHFPATFGGITADGRFSLGVVYLSWIGIVLMMYPLCKWYENYKSTHRKWWSGYL